MKDEKMFREHLEKGVTIKDEKIEHVMCADHG